MLVHEHRGPLVADLHQYHGVRWATIRTSEHTLLEIADWVGGLPPDSAVARATNPEWQLTADSFLLRDIEHALRVLAWQQTADATSKRPKHFPQPIPLTEAEVEAQKPKREYDVMTIDEANEFLGWSA